MDPEDHLATIMRAMSRCTLTLPNFLAAYNFAKLLKTLVQAQSATPPGNDHKPFRPATLCPLMMPTKRPASEILHCEPVRACVARQIHAYGTGENTVLYLAPTGRRANSSYRSATSMTKVFLRAGRDV